LKIVIKTGGEVLRSSQLDPMTQDLVALRNAGHSMLVVHGGGPQVTELQQGLGQTPNIVAGRRITDAAALEAIKMAIAGSVNVDLCAAIVRAGGRPVGLHGASSLVLRARRRPPVVVPGGGPDPIDFGHVGDVIDVGMDLLDCLLQGGYIPALACVAADEHGAVYNVNADAVAARVAVKVGADALVLVTDVPGVLRDRRDPTSCVRELTLSELERGVADGTISRGMIPKLSESFQALAQGVGTVHVVGALGQGQLRRALEEPGAVGTVLRRS
jgi:acetylglutamate kinase